MSQTPGAVMVVPVKGRAGIVQSVSKNNPDERETILSAQYRIKCAYERSRSFRSRMISLINHTFGTEAFPTKPVPVLPFLLLGNESHAHRYELLFTEGVTHICNLDYGGKNYFEGKFIYLKFNFSDSNDEQLLGHFSVVNDFLSSVEQRNGRALLHCFTGKSLSPAFAVAFLIGIKQQKLAQAVQTVQALKPLIKIHPSHLEQLQQFEQKCAQERAEKTTS